MRITKSKYGINDRYKIEISITYNHGNTLENRGGNCYPCTVAHLLVLLLEYP